MLSFRSVTLSDRKMIEGYFFKWGEHSCQHSFMSVFGTQGKYGDRICEQDGFLYIFRSKRGTPKERVYLFPSGDYSRRDDLRRAVLNVIDDAHSHNTAVRFDTITASSWAILQEILPGRFRGQPNRDYNEYIHSAANLASYPGSGFASRWYDYRTFFRRYAGRVSIELITPKIIPALLEFQKRWLSSRIERGMYMKDALIEEDVADRRFLEHYAELGLSGIVVYLDGKIAGYAFGAPMSGGYYDVLVEKGDVNVQDIYCVLVRELVARCCAGFNWINREEDCGEEGMRRAKMSYRPDFFIEKVTAYEIT